MTKKQRKMAVRLPLGAVCFVGAAAAPLPDGMTIALFLAAYLAAGYDIVLRAFRNISRGQVFDENFLMTVATFGAIGVGALEEAVAVMLFYQVGELFNDYAVNRSRRSISDLMDINPEYANLLKDGTETRVDPFEVGVGDMILVRPGERVPLDGTVIEGSSSLDTKALTGESLPADAETGSRVVSGSINLTGVLKIRVEKLFDDSTVAKILELVENASSRKAKAETFIARFARVYTPAVVFMAAALAVIPPVLSGGGFGIWIYRACSFLVVSCPCALVISVPLSFFGGIGAASRNGILIKGSNYLEALGALDTVVFDKTGTLTTGEFQVTDIEPVCGSREDLLELAALAEQHSGHPIARSILEAYAKEPDLTRIRNVEELAGRGIHAEILDGGVWKELFIGNKKLMAGLLLDCGDYEPAAGTALFVAADGKYLGAVVIADTVRRDVPDMLAGLKEAGVRNLVMLTGDREAPSRRLAEKLGIGRVYGNLLPTDKVDQVEALLRAKPEKSTLAFVGDGINDAPVLARADVGIALGGIGSDAAVEAADVVIMDDAPSKIVDAIWIAKKTVGIVKQNIVFAVGVKVLVLILTGLGRASMWAAVFGDVGVSVLAILNAMRALWYRRRQAG